MTLRVLVDPPVVNQADGDRVQEVVLLPARAACHDEPCLLQHAQVLHHAEARHLEVGVELGERAAVTLVEPVEEMPPGGVCERLEDEIVVTHVAIIGDHMVTCQ